MCGSNVVSRCLYDNRETDIITKTSTSPPKKKQDQNLAYLTLTSTFSCTTDNDGHQVMTITRTTF